MIAEQQWYYANLLSMTCLNGNGSTIAEQEQVRHVVVITSDVPDPENRDCEEEENDSEIQALMEQIGLQLVMMGRDRRASGKETSMVKSKKEPHECHEFMSFLSSRSC